MTLRDFATYLPHGFALPHPSWRSKIWMTQTPWFEQRVLPSLRKEVAGRLAIGA